MLTEYRLFSFCFCSLLILRGEGRRGGRELKKRRRGVESKSGKRRGIEGEEAGDRGGGRGRGGV